MEDMTPLLGLPFTELEQLYLSSSPIRMNNLLGPLLQKVIYNMRVTINIVLIVGVWIFFPFIKVTDFYEAVTFP